MCVCVCVCVCVCEMKTAQRILNDQCKVVGFFFFF